MTRVRHTNRRRAWVSAAVVSYWGFRALTIRTAIGNDTPSGRR
ncbi:MAG: hypothetical protein LZF60_250130 [Nitrospira sp.]|nr:MAG: hypothetical protein LZF60_250130 [Nitrospira sp.]